MQRHEIVLATSPFLRDFQKYDQSIDVIDWSNTSEIAGVIFSGGADISPHLYGQKNVSSYPHKERDEEEVAVYNWAKKLGLKMFGVCRGHQLLNALEGGSLTQDLRHASVHSILWMGASELQPFFPHGVNSMHHQGYYVYQAAPSMEVMAVEPSTGVVEASESRDGKIITVQFHPEFMFRTRDGFFSHILSWLRR